MFGDKIMKKILVLFCISILIFCEIESIAKNTITINESQVSTNNTNSDYWAVLIYTNVTDITSIYNSICNKPNWNKSNIILLKKEEATRENIFNALDWLKTNVDSNDIVLFSFNGHGTYINGKYGFGPWDHDTIFINELDEKLDLIECKYLCLIFDCCFSGGFANGNSILFNKYNNMRLNNRIQLGLDGQNRVILMSSGKNGGGFSASVLENDVEVNVISFTRFVADGFENGIDYNNDGWVSAEEGFRYGKKKFMPYAIIFFLFIPLQITAFIQSRGYFLIPFPNIYDAVEGELKLVKIDSSNGTYLNQIPPSKNPKRFYPEEFITEMQNEPIFIFSSNGTKCYYTTADGLYYTELIDNNWSNPSDLNIFGEYMDFEPNISPDGRTIYFNSIDRPIPDGYIRPRVPIFISEGLNDLWGLPEYIGFGGMYACSSFNNTLYFTHTEMGVDCIAMRKFSNNQYQNIEIIPSPVYSNQYNDQHPFIAPDESYLIFDSEDRPKINDCSLFVSFKINNETWSEPINLGNYITQENAAMARISSDGKYLFYNDVNGYNYWVSTDIIEDLKILKCGN